MKKLTADDVTFYITCEPEDIPFEGNCSAIDDETDREQEAWVRSELERGNEWAWCCVKVTAKWEDFEGVDYLGGCSYRSKKDFIESDYYHSDMKQTALDDLNAKLAETYETIKPLVSE